jgi:transposase InsO family protein
MASRAERRRTRQRGSHWQQQQRRRECAVRTDVAQLADRLQQQGLPAAAVADLLDCPARTLRNWQHRLATGQLQPRPLGRPHLRCTAADSQRVIHFLHCHGPATGMPTLAGAFGGLPTAELRELLLTFRHLWVLGHPRFRYHLDWHRPGTVWAMDFTQVHHPVDNIYPYVFAVRDLASGMILAWQPVADMTSQAALMELEVLFTIHGAPLVLKSDNGSAFLAEASKRFLATWQVWPLYSPPGTPGYNGAIEATIGSLKTRTQYAAYLAGHPGRWTIADLNRARSGANEIARPQGIRGQSPQEAWRLRHPPTRSEREAFAAHVRRLEAELRTQEHVEQDAALDHYEHAALHRRVLTQVLVECRLLTITRRPIPQTFFGQKVADI